MLLLLSVCNVAGNVSFVVFVRLSVEVYQLVLVVHRVDFCCSVLIMLFVVVAFVLFTAFVLTTDLVTEREVAIM